RPHAAIRQRLAQPVSAPVGKEITGGALAEVVIVALLLQHRIDALGVQIGPVTEQNHIVTLSAMALPIARRDDDRPIQARLLLEARMRVIPVSAGLVDLEAV